MATNKIHSDNEFALRVKALGLTYVKLAEISGYSVRTIYNISCNQKPVPAPLNAILNMLEEKTTQKQG